MEPITIQEVAFHRNGIGGQGFYAIRFLQDVEQSADWEKAGIKPPEAAPKKIKNAKWLAILFDEPGQCAVVCLDLMETCGVKFAGGNSWRGDWFESTLRKAIEDQQGVHSGAARVGPFSVPLE